MGLEFNVVEELACHDASCRPPTSGGTGGSISGGISASSFARLCMSSDTMVDNAWLQQDGSFLPVVSHSDAGGYDAGVLQKRVRVVVRREREVNVDSSHPMSSEQIDAIRTLYAQTKATVLYVQGPRRFWEDQMFTIPFREVDATLQKFNEAMSKDGFSVETAEEFASRNRVVTASAIIEDPLSSVERQALIGLRSLMQRHLSSLGVTAALNPAELITDQMEADYLALAVTLWDSVETITEGFGLDILPFEQFYPLVKEAIQTSRNRYIEVLKSLIGRQAENTPTYGEFFFIPDHIPHTGLKPPAPYEVQFGDIRSILGELGGGGPAEVPLATGITGGRIFQDVLTANGLGTAEKLWLYGETARRTFNGHLQIDGLVFTDWEDPALDIAPQDYWLRTAKYRPGDHWGCACVVVPYVPNFGAPIPMTIQAAASVEEFYSPSQARDKEGRWTAHRGQITSLASERIDRAYGRGTVGVFGNSQTTTPVPWPSAPRQKGRQNYKPELVQKALSHNPPLSLEKVDPRLLYATQPNIVRSHFDHYMGGNSGLSADHNAASNAQPIVYVNAQGQHLLLTGHHRAAVSLASGEDLSALVVRE